MQKQEHSIGRLALPSALIFLPVALFSVILVRCSLNLPLMDDYPAMLHPLLRLAATSSLLGKLSFFLAYQHSEYKLWLDLAAVWLQTSIFGHPDFRVLSLVGDSFMFPIGFLLWRLCPTPLHGGVASRLLWFAPASALLFQLSYCETLDWSMAALQNLPVVLFAFLALVLLLQRSSTCFYLATGCLVLAVASSGNGLLVIPIGAWILLHGRLYRRLAGWLLISAALVAGYAFHYNTMSSQVAHHRSIFTTITHLNPMYALAMLGSIVGLRGAVLLGVLLCAFNLYLLATGFFRLHPGLGYCTLFVFLTALGVAGARSEFGLAQAITSRYRIYTTLLAAFAWLAIVYKARTLQRTTAQRLLWVSIAFTLLVLLQKDWTAYNFLKMRQQYALLGMARYQVSLHNGTAQGPLAWAAGQNPVMIEWNGAARTDLQQADSTGLYRTPR